MFSINVFHFNFGGVFFAVLRHVYNWNLFLFVCVCVYIRTHTLCREETQTMYSAQSLHHSEHILHIMQYPSLFSVVRHVAFRRGSEVNLTCSNKTWNDLMFVVWVMTLQTKKTCRIAFESRGESYDSCKDGKSLRNTSGALSYLHISKFSDADEGLYKCESVYTGGNDHHAIHVTIIGRTLNLQ